MTPEEEKVLDANKHFYSAMQSLNIEEMESIWMPEEWVKCLHPGWDMLEGWEAVHESWQQIFENTKFMRITMGVQSVHVEKTTAWVCCTEKIASATEGRFETAYVQATNIFKLHNGTWLLVHHHASHLPAPLNNGAPEVVQ